MIELTKKYNDMSDIDFLYQEFFSFDNSLSKEEFIDLLTIDDDFYKKWGADSCYELAYDERYKIWFRNNYETGMEFAPSIPPDFSNTYYEPTPKRKIKI